MLSVLRQNSVELTTWFSQSTCIDHHRQKFLWEIVNFGVNSLRRRMVFLALRLLLNFQMTLKVFQSIADGKQQQQTISNQKKKSKLFKCRIDRLFECGYRRYGYWSSLTALVSKPKSTKPICQTNKNWKKSPASDTHIIIVYILQSPF